MLEEYENKRQFNATPEPPPANSRGSSNEFVIQKHSSRRLHYDFRIEHNGVLVSWAVPKGLPIGSEKHLAVKVEDHPIEYKNFEGIIPPGNYGAGKVEIFDKGNYKIDDNLDKKLNQGHFKIELDGRKIKGEFIFARLEKKENDWIVFRGDDQTDNLLKKGKIESMPKNIQPMLATIVESPFDDINWIFEIKWDGYRIISLFDGKRSKLQTRNLIDATKNYRKITKDLEAISEKPFIADGEVVYLDEEGHPNFQRLQDKSGKEDNIYYFIFDLIFYDNRSFEKVFLSERKQLIAQTLLPNGNVKISEYVESTGISFFQAAKQLGLEGIMAKKKSSFYYPGARSKEWLKIKVKNFIEALVVGYTLPNAGRKFYSALLIADKGGSFLGKVGTGFNDKAIKQIYTVLNKAVSTKPDSYPIVKDAVWTKPILSVLVSYTERTESGLLRHPSFVKVLNCA